MCSQPCAIAYLTKRMTVRLKSSKCKGHVYQESSAALWPTKHPTFVANIAHFTNLVPPHKPCTSVTQTLTHTCSNFTLSGEGAGVRLDREAKQRLVKLCSMNWSTSLRPSTRICMSKWCKDNCSCFHWYSSFSTSERQNIH